MSIQVALSLNGLIAALFVVFGLATIVTRQMLGTLQFFMLHALTLAASAVVLAFALGSPHLGWVALITVATKVIAVPLVLRWAAGNEIYERLLGIRPSLALINEQAYSAGLVPLYLDACSSPQRLRW